MTNPARDTSLGSNLPGRSLPAAAGAVVVTMLLVACGQKPAAPPAEPAAPPAEPAAAAPAAVETDAEKVNELLDQADAQCTEGNLAEATATLATVNKMVGK